MEYVAPPLVICNEEQRFLVAEQLRASLQSDWTIILEPIGRNTAFIGDIVRYILKFKRKRQ